MLRKIQKVVFHVFLDEEFTRKSFTDTVKMFAECREFAIFEFNSLPYMLPCATQLCRFRLNLILICVFINYLSALVI